MGNKLSRFLNNYFCSSSLQQEKVFFSFNDSESTSAMKKEKEKIYIFILHFR